MAQARVTITKTDDDLDSTAPTVAGSAAVGTVIVDYEDTSEVGDIMAAIETAKTVIFRDLTA